MRTAQNEEALIHQHINISKDGFKALEKVTAFCCCGCGLCVSICPLQSIEFDEIRKRPRLAGKCNMCGFCYLACPRSFLPLKKIEQAYYGHGGGEEERRLGKFQDLFVARSLVEEIYQQGTPGGTTTAIVNFLIERAHVDAALLTKGKNAHIQYSMQPVPYIASTPEDVLLSSHSKFEISPVLSKLHELAGYERSLFVGTPCHILAFRKLQILCSDRYLSNNMPELARVAKTLTQKVKFAISINCFLNHTNMDSVYKWLNLREEDVIRFNENVSKDLYQKALQEGADWRWFLKNTIVTRDGQETDYDLLQMGVMVLSSGCLVCNDLITSKHADASIGFFGAEVSEKEFGWNLVSIMNPELKEIVDEMVIANTLERRPVLRGYGRNIRIPLEWIIQKWMPDRDVMGVDHYMETGKWLYPKTLKKIKGPRRGTYMLGLELLFLTQTIRKKLFFDGPVKKLKKAGAYLTAVY